MGENTKGDPKSAKRSTSRNKSLLGQAGGKSTVRPESLLSQANDRNDLLWLAGNYPRTPAARGGLFSHPDDVDTSGIMSLLSFEQDPEDEGSRPSMSRQEVLEAVAKTEIGPYHEGLGDRFRTLVRSQREPFSPGEYFEEYLRNLKTRRKNLQVLRDGWVLIQREAERREESFGSSITGRVHDINQARLEMDKQGYPSFRDAMEDNLGEWAEDFASLLSYLEVYQICAARAEFAKRWITFHIAKIDSESLFCANMAQKLEQNGELGFHLSGVDPELICDMDRIGSLPPHTYPKIFAIRKRLETLIPEILRIGDFQHLKDIVSEYNKIVAKEERARIIRDKQAALKFLAHSFSMSFTELAAVSDIAQSAITRFMSKANEGTADLKDSTVSRIVTAAVDHITEELGLLSPIAGAYNRIVPKREQLTRLIPVPFTSYRSKVGNIDVGFWEHKSYLGEEDHRFTYVASKTDSVNLLLTDFALKIATAAIVAPNSAIGNEIGNLDDLFPYLDISLQEINTQQIVDDNEIRRLDELPAEEMTAVLADINGRAANTVEAVDTEGSRRLPIMGEVQAGALREAFEENDPEEHMPVPDQTRNGAEFCLRVRGDSMDEVFPEGTLLFCRPFYEEDHALPVDKYVIAVTSSAHTDQIEATVKRLVRNDNGDLVLRPESRNKILHGRDLALGADTELGTEVRISAVVVGYTRQLD